MSFLLLLLFCPVHLHADELENRREAASLISAYVANVEAIETFDLLWRCEEQKLGDDGATGETVSYGRLMVDTKRGRCCGVMKRMGNETDSGKDGAASRSHAFLSAVIGDGVQTWYRYHLPAKANRLTDIGISGALARIDGVYVQGIGFVGFPLSYYQTNDIRTHVEYLRRGAISLELAEGLGNTQVFSFELKFSGPLKMRRSFVFDRMTFTPVGLRESTLSGDRTVSEYKESYAFKSLDGIYVPITIAGNKHQRTKVGESAVHREVIYDVQLRWFSVNKPLDDKYFDIHILQDDKVIADLVSAKLLETPDRDD